MRVWWEEEKPSIPWSILTCRHVITHILAMKVLLSILSPSGTGSLGTRTPMAVRPSHCTWIRSRGERQGEEKAVVIIPFMYWSFLTDPFLVISNTLNITSISCSENNVAFRTDVYQVHVCHRHRRIDWYDDGASPADHSPSPPQFFAAPRVETHSGQPLFLWPILLLISQLIYLLWSLSCTLKLLHDD